MGSIIIRILLVVLQAVIVKMAEVFVEHMPEMFGKKKARWVVDAYKTKLDGMRRR